MHQGNPKWREILDYINQQIQKNGCPPTVREIGQAVGLRSPSTVHGYLNRLAKEGYIQKLPASSRGVRIAPSAQELDYKPGSSCEFLEVPLIGRVSAGLPILAEENFERTIPLPMDFARGGDLFILRVRGDSMINAGILNGDFVVVRQQPSAEDGDIIVALLDDSATVKTFYKESNGLFRLQPENDALSPIYTDSLAVLGKVVGVYRIM